MGRLSRHLDSDGLTTFNDPVQQGIQKIKEDYEREIKVIRNHLAAANAALLQHASACSGGTRCILDKDDMVFNFRAVAPAPPQFCKIVRHILSCCHVVMFGHKIVSDTVLRISEL